MEKVLIKNKILGYLGKASQERYHLSCIEKAEKGIIGNARARIQAQSIKGPAWLWGKRDVE